MTTTICLSFDFDAISLWLYRHDRPASPSAISRGEFGRIGAERLLDLLERRGIPATWFIPGHTIETYPATAERIAASHEVGHHGYLHEHPARLSRDDERAVLHRGMDLIRGLTGAPPAGYRSPAWDLSPHSVDLLLEAGFRYDSSLMGNDFSPYRVRQGDESSPDGPYRFGQPTRLVEMPVDWALDDFPYFSLDWAQRLVGLREPDEVFRAWLAEFDYAASLPDSIFILTMHPQVIGRGSRIRMLERLIDEMQGYDDVVFRRMGDVAAEWDEAHPLH
jgi:peptidoglycan/xylan/chitin deacetylase (PgdA/CDA1 family)